MPRIDAGGVELFYESLGEGTPLVLQAHDHTPWMFFQAPIFSQWYRFITYDRRGTGRSASPPGDWNVSHFASDLCGLLDAARRSANAWRSAAVVCMGGVGSADDQSGVCRVTNRSTDGIGRHRPGS